MSENISPIHVKGSPYVPSKTVKGQKTTAAKEAPQSAKQPVDQVELSNRALPSENSQVSVSESDMQRYRAMLDEMPDIRDDKLDAVIQKLERGEYGEDALQGTVEGLMDELGL